MATLEEALTHDFATPFRAVMARVDELSRDVRDQGRDIREIKERLATIDTRLGTMDSRLNGLDGKVDALREEMNTKFDQVLALLAQGRSAQ